MKSYFIRPKEYISQRFEKQYIDYTKKQALKLYKEEFKSFTTKELKISKQPYINL